MIKAVMEMGTNSTRLLIADLKKRELKVLKKDLITTRLGEGVDKNKRLNGKAVERGLKALRAFKKEIDKYDVSSYKLVGTSALRDVNNGEKFQKLIKEEIGYDLEIISGQKEAEFIFKGVTFGYDFSDYIIIDIGGGSTEFICKNIEEEQVEMKSLDIGAVRLTERFIADPALELSKNVIKKMSKFVEQELEKEIEILTGEDNLIGVGGTITTLAAILLKLENYDPQAIHDYVLDFSQVNKVLDKLRKLDLAKRKKVKGLNPDRADIIIAGIVILIEIMKNLRSLKLRVSDYDMLHGLLIEA
ncbi:MAG TPA: Ppx/GppA family phosphatase [Halanaerobiales bacterium]|nr:Ppx/GppA family phosphatase [Halanaerobiales bacterium]